MSNAVFPTLAGRGWNIQRAPGFTNRRQKSVSGREIGVSYQAYPLTTFTLNYDVLVDSSLYPDADTLVGFFLARQGSYDSFLYNDTSDNAVIDMQFGTGDGTTRAFQLTRAFGAGGFTFAEPVQNVNVLTNIKKAGTLQTVTTDYTIDANGLVTFTTAPAAAAALAWSGTFYFRCRFTHDSIDLKAMMTGLWSAQKVEFIGAPGNRV